MERNMNIVTIFGVYSQNETKSVFLELNTY